MEIKNRYESKDNVIILAIFPKDNEGIVIIEVDGKRFCVDKELFYKIFHPAP